MDQPDDNVEPILKFKELYNFNDVVNKHLLKDLQPTEIEEVNNTVKIVGQERSGSFLFSWTVNRATYIAIHFPNGPIHKLLYKFQEPTNIVSASVNEDTSLLAFTIIKENPDNPTFGTYIVNIHSEAKPVPLKLDTFYYHKVLFLKSMGFDYRKLGTIHPEAKLLLIMHRVGVVFYQLHLRTIQNYTVISDEPKEESITEEIDWYQWDSINQWLYYARFFSPEERGVTIACIDFSQAYHIVLFCVQFGLPYDSFHYNGKTSYYNSPGAFVLPQKEINIQILQVKDGLWCVCIQHSDGSHTEDGQYKLEYSVFMMHNAHVLKGYINLNEKSEHGISLHFMLLGQFVAVYAPGHLFHLLNVGAKSDPCHHLILGKEFTPSLPCHVANPRLSYVMSTSLIGEFDSTFMECNMNVSYQCQLNQVAFLYLFKIHPPVKLNLIHLALVCLRQPEIANSMISSLAQNPLSSDVPDILAEYIISAAYASMQYECKTVILKLLPLTTKSTFQGVIVKDSLNQTNVRLQCTPIKKFVQQLQGQCEASFDLSHPEELLTYIPEGPLGVLYFNAVLSTSNMERLHLPLLMSSPRVSSTLPKLDSASASSPPQLRSHVSRSASDSVIGRITATLTGRRRGGSSPGQLSNETLSFLTVDEEFQESLVKQKELLRYKCYEFYSKRLPVRLKTIIQGVAKSYTSNLLLQLQVVLDTIWKIVGFTLESNPVDKPIHSDSPAKELLLYELIEGYFLALNQLKLPVPEGFHSFFIILGYRCLDRLLFIQYLENGVLCVTRRFVDSLIADIDNGNDDIIMEILSHLEPEAAQKALKKWDNAPFNMLRDRTTKPI